MDKAIEFYQYAFDGVFGLLNRLSEHFGIIPIAFALLIVSLSVRFLLQPVVGGSFLSGASDFVKKQRKSRLNKKGS